jgi:hypothetical protein
MINGGTMLDFAIDNQLKLRHNGIVHAREGREGRFTTDEVLACFEIRYKGNGRTALRAVIVNLIDSLASLIDADALPAEIFEEKKC